MKVILVFKFAFVCFIVVVRERRGFNSPNATRNLVSVSHMQNDGWKVTFHKTGCTMEWGGQYIHFTLNSDGLYVAKLLTALLLLIDY